MIIDAHAHVWPPAIAARALAATRDVTFVGDGTVDGLRATQDRAGVGRSVCLAITKDPRGLEAANAFAGRLPRDRCIPFGTVHPGVSPEENLASLRRARVHGVKVHPIFQRTPLDDPAYLAIFRLLAGEFPITVHMGSGAGSDSRYSSPRMLREVSLALPELDIVACHLGGYHDLDDAIEELVGLPVHLDTSWPPSVDTLAPDLVRKIIELHGSDRIVFGSDWPAADPVRELEGLRALGLSEHELDNILGANMQRLLGL